MPLKIFCNFINYIMFTNISLCEGEFFPSKTGSSIVHCVLDPDQQKRSGSSVTGENIYISRQDTIYYYILLYIIIYYYILLYIIMPDLSLYC